MMIKMIVIGNIFIYKMIIFDYFFFYVKKKKNEIINKS